MGKVLEDLLSPLHIVLLLVVALLIFGPRRLPELGGAVGKTIKEFQKSMNEARTPVQGQTTSTPHASQPVSPSGAGDSPKPN